MEHSKPDVGFLDRLCTAETLDDIDNHQFHDKLVQLEEWLEKQPPQGLGGNVGYVQLLHKLFSTARVISDKLLSLFQSTHLGQRRFTRCVDHVLLVCKQLLFLCTKNPAQSHAKAREVILDCGESV